MPTPIPPKVLLVMPATPARARLESALGAAGYALETAEEALFALTEFERNAPDVVVSAAGLPDMSGREFFEMLKEDGQLERTGFVLLEGLRAQLMGRGFDIQIPEGAGPEDVVAFVRGLLDKRDRPQPRPTASASAAPRKVLSRSGNRVRATEFGGTLEHFSLFDLLMLLVQTGKTGQLFVHLGQEEAMLLLEGGKLTHAQYAGGHGEAAIERIFLDAERSPTSEFAFDAPESGVLPPELRGMSSVSTPSDQLLLNVALALDEYKTGSGR